MNVINATTLRNNLSDAISKINKDKDYMLIAKRGKVNSVIVDIDYFEDLLEQTNNKYLKSIIEARKQAAAGEVFTHEEIFGEI